jgi:hypothetical protein
MSEKKSSISRRKFLASSSALTSGLILGAPGMLTGKYSQNDEVDPDYFILLSDTHIDENPHRLRNETNIFSNLEIAVRRILNENEFGKPAGVIILGDIANTFGLVSEYGLAWSMLRHLSKAGIPVHFAMGDQDNRGNFYTVFPDQIPEVPLIRNHHVEIIEAPNTYHFILDSLARSSEYIAGGELGHIQRNWLDSVLGNYNDKPVMLHCHHYPWPDTQTDGTVQGLKDYQEYLEIAHSHRHVKACIFGHSLRFETSLDKDLHFLNVPTTAGHEGSQPVGYIHAFFYPDKMRFQIECIDTSESWHGDSGTLEYRSDETTSAEQPPEKTEKIQLHQNYPNPFNSSTNISYHVSHPDHVSLRVYTSDGQLVVTLVDGFQSAGLHEVTFDASRLASGNYVYRLTSGEQTLTKNDDAGEVSS